MENQVSVSVMMKKQKTDDINASTTSVLPSEAVGRDHHPLPTIVVDNQMSTTLEAAISFSPFAR